MFSGWGNNTAGARGGGDSGLGAACTPFQEALACRLVHPLPETTSQARVGPGMELPHSASPGKCYSSHLSRKTLFPSETPTQKIDESGAAMWKQGRK